MFGMGFMEILLIAVIAIIALGPEKLPSAMVEIAKFIKKFKSGVEDAKSTLDNELNMDEMRSEASKFKAQIEDAKSTVSFDNNKVDLGLDSIINDDMESKTKKEIPEEPESLKDENEKVSFSKKKKKKKKSKETKEDNNKTVEDSNEEFMQNAANKFKVNFDEEKEDKKEDNA